MNNLVYLSSSHAGSPSEIDIIRRALKKSGYEVIEHTGAWTNESMNKFLMCENKLIMPPDNDEFVGRGQAEMIDAALDNEMPIYYVVDYDANGLGYNITVQPILSLDFIREDYRNNWAAVESDYEVECLVTEAFPLPAKGSYTHTKGITDNVKPMLATALMD